MLSWVVGVHGCILLGFVGVPNRVLLGFVWCSWLCFPKALLLLLVMFSKALLMFVVIALMGFVSVHGCCFFWALGVCDRCSLGLCWHSWSCFLGLLVFMVMLSWALLVFLVIVFMGFVGVYGHVILVSTIVHVVGSWILMGKS